MAGAVRDCLPDPHRRWLIPTAEVPLTNLVRESSSPRSAAHAAHGADTVLPCGSGCRRQGYPRHDTPASVRQGGARLHHHAGAGEGRARAHARLRRGSAAPARPALSHRHAVRGRHGISLAEDLRHRGLAAGAEHVPRNLVLLALRRVPGAADECALSGRGGTSGAVCAHAQRLGRCRRPRAHRGHGDRSERPARSRCRTSCRATWAD